MDSIHLNRGLDECVARSTPPARRGDFIQLVSGRAFWPLDPRPGEVHVEDIAHALSHLCRFTGHTRELYTVAEHSVRVSHQVPAEHALWGLLHDASEAYLCDLAAPVKHHPDLVAYRAAEHVVMAAVCARFGLSRGEPATVKLADRRMLRTEQRDLMPPPCPGEDRGDVEPYEERIVPWSPAEAKVAFLRRFAQLGGV